MDGKMSEQSAIVVAAGTAITMACMKRIMVMFFAEQWRTKVFLLLNLVLLAIFFTSVRSCSNNPDEESGKNEELKVGKMKRRKLQCGSNNRLSESEDSYKGYDRMVVSEENLIGVEVVSSIKGSRIEVSSGVSHEKSEEKVVEADEAEEKQFEGVDESDELNERAEAFIAMFRKHLALDARQANINSRWNIKANRLLISTTNY